MRPRSSTAPKIVDISSARRIKPPQGSAFAQGGCAFRVGIGDPRAERRRNKMLARSSIAWKCSTLEKVVARELATFHNPDFADSIGDGASTRDGGRAVRAGFARAIEEEDRAKRDEAGAVSDSPAWGISVWATREELSDGLGDGGGVIPGRGRVTRTN
jgi:hypothetical protein